MTEVAAECPTIEFCKDFKANPNEDFAVRHFEVLTRGEDSGLRVSLCMAEDTLRIDNGSDSLCPVRSIFWKAKSEGFLADVPAKDQLVDFFVELGMNL